MGYIEPPKDIQIAFYEDEIKMLCNTIYRRKIDAETATIIGNKAKCEAIEKEITGYLQAISKHEEKLAILKNSPTSEG